MQAPHTPNTCLVASSLPSPGSGCRLSGSLGHSAGLRELRGCPPTPQFAALLGLQAHPQPSLEVSLPRKLSAPTVAPSLSPRGPGAAPSQLAVASVMSPALPGFTGWDPEWDPWASTGTPAFLGTHPHRALWAVQHTHSRSWWSQVGLRTGDGPTFSYQSSAWFKCRMILSGAPQPGLLGPRPHSCLSDPSARQCPWSLGPLGLSHTSTYTHRKGSGFSGPTLPEPESYL